MNDLFGIEFRSGKIYEGPPILSIEGTSIDLLPFLLMFVFLTTAAVLFKTVRNRRVARKLVQAFSALAFAFGMHPCFCMLRNVLRGAQFISRDNIYAMGMIILFAIVVSFTLVHGRIFCGWVCPLGFFQELLGLAGKKIFSKAGRRARILKYSLLFILFVLLTVGYEFLKPRTFVFTQSIMVYSAAVMLLVMMFCVADSSLHPKLVYVRYVSLAAVMGLFLAGTYFNMPGCVFYCTIDDFGSVLSVFAVIFSAFVIPLGWCRYICPEGAVLSLCGGGSHLQIQRDESRCISCGKCAVGCQMQAISKDGNIRDNTSCVRCGRCIEVCPQDALSFQPSPVNAALGSPASPKKAPGLARFIFPVVLFICAAAVICLARNRLVESHATSDKQHPILTAPALVEQDAPAEWRMFGHDARHSGQTSVEFPSADLEQAWTFRGTKHTWTYRKQASVWSSSPVVSKVGGKWMLFVGSYDRSIYALDAKTGHELWRVSAGDSVFSAPAIGDVDGRKILYVVPTDRKVYALDARTGKKIWAHELLEWSDTVAPSIAASPAFGYVSDTPLLVVGIHINDQFGPRNIQDGKTVVYNAATGMVLWEKKLSKSPLTSPVLCNINGHAAVIVGSTDGSFYCFDALSGTQVWESLLLDLSFSSPAVGTVNGKPYVFVGSRFHTMYAIDARTGNRIWQRRANNFIDATPSLATIDGKLVIFYGSYDRRFYCVDAASSEILWYQKTGCDICSSSAVVSVGGQPAVIVHSLDDNLYMFDARTGEKLWQHFVGHVMWSHIERTDSIWSSPAVANVDGTPMVFFGSYDGKLYAFTAKEGKK